MKHGRDRAIYLFMQEVRRLARDRGFIVSSAESEFNVWDKEGQSDTIRIVFIPEERPKEWMWNGMSTECGVCHDGPCMAEMMPPDVPLMHDSVCLKTVLQIKDMGVQHVRVRPVDYDERLEKLEQRVQQLVDGLDDDKGK